jgi:hypothetical protein
VLVVDSVGKIIYRLRRVPHTLLLLGHTIPVHQQIAIFVALLLSKGVQQLLELHRELIQVLAVATGAHPVGLVLPAPATVAGAQVGTLETVVMVAVGLADMLLTAVLAVVVVVVVAVLHLQLVQAQEGARAVVV